jgi:hypothetical protein
LSRGIIQFEIGFQFRINRVSLIPAFQELALQSSQNTAVKILESPIEDERIEVLLEHLDATPRVVLRYSTWTDGLGWCGQKTIHLDSQHLDDLHHAITVARHRINLIRGESGEVVQSDNVIQLPNLS